MALSFTGGDSDRVDVSSYSDVEGMATGTIVFWVYWDDISPADNRQFFTKQGEYGVAFSPWGAGDKVQGSVVRGTTNLDVAGLNANFSHLASTKWLFLAFTWDTGGANADQRLLIGDLDSPAAEPSAYSTQTVGSGAVASGANNLIIGCDGGHTLSFNGDIALCGIFDVHMTNAEIQAQQHSLYPLRECVGWWNLGFNGTGSQTDWAGGGNNGTVTGAVLADHVPLAIMRREKWAPYNVYPGLDIVWGHDTAVLETVIRDFDGNWTGTGEIDNPGVADTERLALEATEYMISEIVHTGAIDVEVLYNEYAAGDAIDLDYRTGATPAACVAAGWNNYAGSFTSSGYVQVRVTSTL